MIVFEHILTRDEACNVEPKHVLDIDWSDLNRRAVRKTTRGGTKVGILLPRNVFFRHGDLLRSAAGDLMLINQLETQVLMVESADVFQAASLAWAVGNLHLPIEIEGQRIAMLDDGPTEALLVRSGLAFARQTRRFVPISDRNLPRFETKL